MAWFRAGASRPLPRETLAPWVGALSLVSLAGYVAVSPAVAQWRASAGYLRFVARTFLEQPRPAIWSPEVTPVPGVPLLAAVALCAALAVGAAVWVAMRRQPGAAAMGWVAGMLAAVIPPQVVALVWWPDGQGKLSPGVLAGAHLLLVPAAWAWAWYEHRARPPHEFRAMPKVRLAQRHAAPRAPAVPDSSPWWVLPVVAAAVVLFVVALGNGLTAIQGYDSFSDHLARPARWLATRHLEPGSPGEVVTYYPGNFELLVRWTMTLGTDRLGVTVAWASAVASLWVLYRIARELGQGAWTAALSAGAAASLQVLAYQSLVVYSDGYTALCLLLATWLLLVWVREGAADLRLVGGLGGALGLAMGAKYSAGPPVVIIGLLWLWHARRDLRDDDPLGEGPPPPVVDGRWLLPQLGVLVAAALPGMAFWYGRNLLLEGNPVYPLGVAGLPGIPLGELLAGAPGPRSWWTRLSYPWLETGHGPGFETGMGATFAAVVVLAIPLAPWGQARGAATRRLAWLLLLGAFAAWVRSGVLVPRYGLFPLLLSFAFVGTLWEAFPSRLLRAVTVVAAVGTMTVLTLELAGGALYQAVTYRPGPPVPAVLDTLPAARILNLAGEPSGYYAMGRDRRHRVLSRFRRVTPADVPALRPNYLLIPESREAEFRRALPMTLLGRWRTLGADGDSVGTALWQWPALGDTTPATAAAPAPAPAAGGVMPPVVRPAVPPRMPPR